MENELYYEDECKHEDETPEPTIDPGIDNRACVRVLTFEGKVYRGLGKVVGGIWLITGLLFAGIACVLKKIYGVATWIYNAINWCVVESITRLVFIVGYPIVAATIFYDMFINQGALVLNKVLDTVGGGHEPLTTFPGAMGPVPSYAGLILLGIFCLMFVFMFGWASSVDFVRTSDHKYAKVIRESMENKR